MSSSLTIVQQFRRQAGWCQNLGSPLYSHLLSLCADDYEKDGAVRDLLRGYEDEPAESAVPLRMMGAIHRLVLEGRSPEVAKFYSSAGGRGDLDATWHPFRNTLHEGIDALRRLVQNPLQTNDVGRSGSLLGGFALVSEKVRLPLRLLEIGSSGGVNLRWGRYR